MIQKLQNKNPAGTRWEITVYTSDIRHAGTDAEVYINMFGNKGRSGRIVLGEGLKERDDFFERASVDVFTPEVCCDFISVGRNDQLIPYLTRTVLENIVLPFFFSIFNGSLQ